MLVRVGIYASEIFTQGSLGHHLDSSSISTPTPTGAFCPVFSAIKFEQVPPCTETSWPCIVLFDSLLSEASRSCKCDSGPRPSS
jgi:hypothetical protein